MGEMENDKVRCSERTRTDQETARQDGILIPGLPNELGILCIARVPASYHCNMRGVCQSWRNICRGKVFWKVQQELSIVEEVLCLWIDSDNGGGKGTWHCFDPFLKEWWKLPPIVSHHGIVGHSAFASVDGKLFVIGGGFYTGHNAKDFSIPSDDSYIPFKTVSYFDMKKFCWKRAANLNIARARCVAGVINNQLHVFGGFIGGFRDSTVTTVTVEVYDIVNDTWTLISDMKFPFSAAKFDCVMMGGKVYGMSAQNEVSGMLYHADKSGTIYDPYTSEQRRMTKWLNFGWVKKSAVFKGKVYNLYQVGLARSLNFALEIDQQFRVYNLSSDVWETNEDFSGQRVQRLGEGEIELVGLGGKLCIISVNKDRSRIADSMILMESLAENSSSRNDDSIIRMEIFEVKESAENACSVKFSSEFQIQVPYLIRRMPNAIRRCHVITL